jgi:excinuclease UvrABC nuclease subunit
MIDYPPLEISEKLNWSNPYNWNDLVSKKINVPNSPGVYEVLSEDCDRCLDIGMAGNLNRRILKQLTGKGKHSTKKRMESKVDLTKLKVRWAETKYPAAVEEHLHRIANPKPEYTIVKKYLK